MHPCGKIQLQKAEVGPASGPTSWHLSAHLVPHQLDVARVLALDEAREVVLHDPAAAKVTSTQGWRKIRKLAQQSD